MTLPIYFITIVPRDLRENVTLRRRWFMQDEAFLMEQLAEINRILTTEMPDENRRIRLERARDLSIIPALQTLPQRDFLGWDDVHAKHQMFAEELNRWYRSGAATLNQSFGLEFDYRMIYVPSMLTCDEMATEAGIVYGDKRAVENGFTPHPDVWLQFTPSGYGMRPNAVLPEASAKIHEMYPEANYQPNAVDAPYWWRWRTVNGEGKECGTASVLTINGGGWYGTWPRVKGFPEQTALALYGAEPYFRGAVCGIPDPFHVMFGDWPAHGWGESHEIGAHGIGNVSCHNDITGLESNSWTTLQQQTTPFNSSPLAGHWFIEAQTDQLLNAATVEGAGQNDLLRKTAKDPIVRLVANGLSFEVGTNLFPFPQAGEWRWYFNDKLVAVGVSVYTAPGTGAVRVELWGGVNTHGYTGFLLGAAGSHAFAPTPVVISLEVRPWSVAVEVGKKIQLGAFMLYSDGSEVDVTSTCIWNSTNADIATVSNGLVTGKKSGTVNVAAEQGILLNSSTIYVLRKRRRLFW